MQVKPVTPQDLDQTLNTLEQYWGHLEDYDQDSATDTVTTYSAQYHYTWLNWWEDGEVVGFVGGYLGTLPWNDSAITGYITCLYCEPEYHSAEAMQDLVDYFAQWAMDAGAKTLEFRLEAQLHSSVPEINTSVREIN